MCVHLRREDGMQLFEIMLNPFDLGSERLLHLDGKNFLCIKSQKE